MHRFFSRKSSVSRSDPESIGCFSAAYCESERARRPGEGRVTTAE